MYLRNAYLLVIQSISSFINLNYTDEEPICKEIILQILTVIIPAQYANNHVFIRNNAVNNAQTK